MKRFSEIDSLFENKKYQEKSKNDIYSLVKENMSVGLEPLNEGMESDINNVKIDLNGTEDLVNKMDSYVDKVKLNERVSTLNHIKNMISTGTLSLKFINEEINNCECSETCPEFGARTTSEEPEEDFAPIDDYVEDEADEAGEDEIITTQESIILAEEFIKIVEAGQAKNMEWSMFFDKFEVPEYKRTNLTVNKIYENVVKINPDIFED